jgi:hypothetical protein
MIPSTFAEKHYRSAGERNLCAMIDGFFAREFPKFFGAILRRKVVEELMGIIESLHVSTEQLTPGQCLWLALDVKTRGDHPNRRLRPVVLTMFSPSDAEQLASGVRMREVASDAVARIMREAYQQGALLSMRDIELLTWRHSGSLTATRTAYERANDCVLPHTGTLQDMGSCITHKREIVLKTVKEGMAPTEVARQTNHTLRAVERYVNDYQRVVECCRLSPSMDYIARVTRISPHVVAQYLKIDREIHPL